MTKQELSRMCEQLSDFRAPARRHALEQLHARALAGELALAPVKPEVNLHIHTFFSFHAEGWSPSRIAWESYLYGLEVAGVVDFDVLDAMEEFLQAGDLLGRKFVAGIESRVFVEEYKDYVLNSPGEPGIAYFMGTGCTRQPKPDTPAAETLARMARTARERTKGMIARLNAHLSEIAIDYETDVLPLTPAGNATERHLLKAYDAAARRAYPDENDLANFWARALGAAAEECRAWLDHSPTLHERIRARFMKLGGVGYVAPDSGSFPRMETMVDMVREIDALPTYAYLDGSSGGEDKIEALFDLMAAKGVVAINIIPDRNWNFKDPETRAEKVRRLAQAVKAARALRLPIVIGTEMNKAGLPFVDDFRSPALRPFVEDFLYGARFVYGHTVLSRWAGLGYWSEAIEAEVGTERGARNDFFAAVGACAAPNRALREQLQNAAGRLGPQQALQWLRAGR